LLVVTDILITDYSSIPFEFSLLNKPMVFFAYDLETYVQKRGIWERYEQFVPGPIVKRTDELIQVIKEKQFDMQKIEKFAREWNEYSTGNTSRQFVEKFYSC